MTPVTFTGDVLRDIIRQSRAGTPAEAIAATYGWDLPRLARINRDHRIGMFVPEQARSIAVLLPPVEIATDDAADDDDAPEPISSTDTRTFHPQRAKCPRRHEYLTTKISARSRQILADQLEVRSIAPSALLGRILTRVMADDELVAAIARMPVEGSSAAWSIQSASMSEKDCDGLHPIAKSHGVTVSRLVDATIRHVSECDLWDRLLGGEGK